MPRARSIAHAAWLTNFARSNTVRSVRSSAYLADIARRLAPFHDTAKVTSLYGHLIAAGIPVPAS
jgi:hypothetical protein